MLYINLIGDYLYYVSSENENSRIYRIDKNTNQKQGISNDDIVTWMAIDSTQIYYKAFDLGFKKASLNRMNLDGTSKTQISNVEPYGFMISSDSNEIDISYSFEENVFVIADWIYYSNKCDGNKVYKIRTDGTNNTKISDCAARIKEIVGDYIYFIGILDSSDQTKLSKYCRIKTDGSTLTILA